MLYQNFLNYSHPGILLLIHLLQILLDHGHKTYTVHMPDVLGQRKRAAEYSGRRYHTPGIHRLPVCSGLSVRVSADQRNYTSFIHEPYLYFTGVLYRDQAAVYSPVQ